MHQTQPEEIVLAMSGRVRWNVRSSTTSGPMTRKKSLLPEFDACSVALFTSLVFMGPLPSRAQQPPPPRPALAAPRAHAPASSRALGGDTIPPNRWTLEEVHDMFRRADTDGDGQLSPEEAAAWPGLAQHFDRYDTNKDGSISSAEFDEALK
jgi:hypothetical protein